MAGRKQIKWTRAVKARFIEAFEEHGSSQAACRATGLSASSVLWQRKHDPAFADDWNRAMAASQERILDSVHDAVHNGEPVEITGPDGSVDIARKPVSERTRLAAYHASTKSYGAYRAAREADPEADIAARRRVRIGLVQLAERMGILF